jgi:hypothetical protein
MLKKKIARPVVPRAKAKTPAVHRFPIKVYLNAGGPNPPTNMKVLRVPKAPEDWTTADLRAVLSDMVRLADPKVAQKKINSCHFQEWHEGTRIYAQGDRCSPDVTVFPAFRVPPRAIAGLIPFGMLHSVHMSFLPLVTGKARGKRIGGAR